MGCLLGFPTNSGIQTSDFRNIDRFWYEWCHSVETAKHVRYYRINRGSMLLRPWNACCIILVSVWSSCLTLNPARYPLSSHNVNLLILMISYQLPVHQRSPRKEINPSSLGEGCGMGQVRVQEPVHWQGRRPVCRMVVIATMVLIQYRYWVGVLTRLGGQISSQV